jgi:hypothetical protein
VQVPVDVLSDLGINPPTPPTVFDLAQAEAEKNGISPSLVHSVVMTESGGNPHAVSPKGAVGPMQLMPATAKDLGVDPSDPAENVKGGTAYLKQLLDKYGDEPTALMAYNWGPGNVDKWIAEGRDPAKVPQETQAYVQKIMTAQVPESPAQPVVLTPAVSQQSEPAPSETPTQLPSGPRDILAELGIPATPQPSPGTADAAISGLAGGFNGTPAATDATIAGASQGTSAGFGDEMMAGLTAPVEYAGSRVLTPRTQEGIDISKMSLPDIYRMERNRIREANKLAKASNPSAYAAGDIAGSIMSPVNELLPGGTTVKEMAQAGGAYAAANAAGRSDAESLPEVAADMATQGTVGAVLTPAFGKAVEGAGTLINKGLDAVTGVNPSAVADATSMGIDLPLAAASDSRTAGLLDRFLSKFPGSATTMEKAANRTLDQIDQAVDKLGGNRAATQQEAGSIIQAGAQRYVNKFQKVANVLFTRFDDLVPPATPVALTNLRTTISDEAAPFANNPEFRFLMSNTAQGLEQALAKGQDVPYELVKKLRTSIGDKLGKSYLLGDEQSAALKAIYGALTADMRSVAEAQGPKALKAFERANDFYRRGADQIESGLQRVVANKYPEQVFAAALSGTKQGGSKITGIMKALNPDEREILRGTVIKQMGLATPGQQNAAGDLFSVNSFLSNWNRISPEAKGAIFGSGEYRQSVDKLTSVVEHLKKLESLNNKSNTGFYTSIGTLLFGTAAGHPEIISAMPVSWVGAQLMTSPRFVNWLADAAPKKATPEALQQVLRTLPRVAAANPDIQDALKQFISALKPATVQPNVQGGTP